MSKVLIAEDDFASARVLSKLLTSMGHSALISPNGQHAWETLQSNSDIELILTDIMMPIMDGRALIREIRSSSEFNKVPIIVVSAYVGPQGASELLEAGATFIIMKPVQLSEVREYVARCLNSAEADAFE